MMAALLPGLAAGRVLDSKEWVYLEPVVPGAHPLEALKIRLHVSYQTGAWKVLRDNLKDGMGRGLHQLASLLYSITSGQGGVTHRPQFERLHAHDR